MAYKDYKYGGRKKDVKKLLSERLEKKKKIRYHNKVIDTLSIEINELEKEINKYL